MTWQAPRAELVVSEKQLQVQVLDLCSYLGLLAYHTHDSRRSQPGFPDLVIVGAGVVFAELKTESGRISPAQKAWHERLTAAGAEAYVWRPRHLDVISDRLHRLAGRTAPTQEGTTR